MLPLVDAPILIAYDGSDPARHCIDEAARLFGSRRVVVITAWEPGLAYATAMPMSDLGGLSTPADDLGAAREAEEARQERAEGVAHHHHVPSLGGDLGAGPDGDADRGEGQG